MCHVIINHTYFLLIEVKIELGAAKTFGYFVKEKFLLNRGCK